MSAGPQHLVAALDLGSTKTVALIGEVASSRSLAAAPVAQAAKVPMLSPASTNPRSGCVPIKHTCARGAQKVHPVL